MSNYPLLSVIGIEIEYMLVDRDTLDVQPKSDLVLKTLAGQVVNEAVLGDVSVSNELVMHVLELKNNGPRCLKEPIAQHFQKAIEDLQLILHEHRLTLLPTGAHPWMNPLEETQRWPYENKAIYQQYDTIFSCQGHGWSNLQSMHVNLPFETDDDFFQLHQVIRLILPLLPALAASTPILDGKPTGLLDARLAYYEKNQQSIPSISGSIIPEFVVSEAQYEQAILGPMYEDIRPYDPQGILQHPWLNSRGAIPKFDDRAIEIRILDTQECVHADIAIARVIHAILRNWLEAWPSQQNACSTKSLKAIYESALRNGLSTVIEDKEVLTHWQLPSRSMTLRDAWSLLIERVSSDLDSESQLALEHILKHDNLSERILRACGLSFDRSQLCRVYQQLRDCLFNNESFSS
jgi:gamma-glutamyl:cysteine ligase YbdK (ATP-grasp superfamily)